MDEDRVLRLIQDAYDANGQQNATTTQMEAFAGEVLMRLKDAILTNSDYKPIRMSLRKMSKEDTPWQGILI